MATGKFSRRGAWTALAAVAALALLPGCGRLQARLKLKAGNRAYKESQWSAALTAYAQIPDGVPERLNAQLGTAYAHMAQYRFGSKLDKDRAHATAAIAAFDAYLELRPADTRDATLPTAETVEDWAVSMLVDAERYEEAARRLGTQLEVKPNDSAILNGLAKTYDRWNKPVEALGWYQKWAATFPADPAPHVAIAAFCWNMSYRRASALEAIERNRWIDSGLASADAALKIKSEHFEGLTYKNLLLRERAKMRVDPNVVATLVQEASEILARVNELNKQKKAEEERAKAAVKAAETPVAAKSAGTR